MRSLSYQREEEEAKKTTQWTVGHGPQEETVGGGPTGRWTERGEGRVVVVVVVMTTVRCTLQLGKELLVVH